MTLKVSTKKLAWIYILFVGALSGYIEHKNIWSICSLALLVLLLITDRDFAKGLKKNMGVFITGFILFVYYCINMIATNGISGGIKNLLVLIGGFSCLLILLGLSWSKNKNLGNFLNSSFWFINVIGTINLIVVTAQIFIHGFMIKSQWMADNFFYEDLCSGLFGYNATHELTIYFTFWMIYNLYFALLVNKSRSKRNMIIFYSASMFIWMLSISIKNDNMGIFMVFFAFIVSYLFILISSKNKNLVKKIMSYSKYIVLGILVIIILMSIPSINKYVNEDIAVRVYDTFFKVDSNAMGSVERVAILRVFFERGYGLSLGLGVGKYDWTSSYNELVLGFSHFGISSMSSFIVLGGIWLYVLCDIFITLCTQSPLIKKRWSYFILYCFLITFCSFYTVSFTSYISMIWIALILEVFTLTTYEYENVRISINN